MNQTQIATLSNWAFLKCIMFENEQGGGNKRLTPREDRIRFRESRTIPDYYRIYVASHNMGLVKFATCSADLIGFSPENAEPVGDAIANVKRSLSSLGQSSSTRSPLAFGTASAWNPKQTLKRWQDRQLRLAFASSA